MSHPHLPRGCHNPSPSRYWTSGQVLKGQAEHLRGLSQKVALEPQGSGVRGPDHCSIRPA